MARWLSWLERRPVTAEVVGSNPIRVVVIISQMITCWKQLTIIYGVLAQLGEHLPYKQRVTGSSPVTPTFLWTGIVLRISGDDALRGHTRSHSEHDG